MDGGREGGMDGWMDGWIDCEWYFSYIDHVAMTRMDLQIPVQSDPITTNVVSSNPTQARCT